MDDVLTVTLKGKANEEALAILYYQTENKVNHYRILLDEKGRENYVALLFPRVKKRWMVILALVVVCAMIWKTCTTILFFLMIR